MLIKTHAIVGLKLLDDVIETSQSSLHKCVWCVVCGCVWCVCVCGVCVWCVGVCGLYERMFCTTMGYATHKMIPIQ